MPTLYYRDPTDGLLKPYVPSSNPALTGRNRIINGDMSVNQRGGSSTSASAAYLMDRWMFQPSVGTCTWTAEPVAAGLPEHLRYSAKMSGSPAPTSGYMYLHQFMEDLRAYTGRTFTLSFYAKGSVAGVIGVTFCRGLSPGSDMVMGQVFPITTTWARYVYTFTVPSLGVAVGVDNYLSVRFVKYLGTDYAPALYGLPSAVAYTGDLSITGVQVEPGPVATPFEQKSYGDELNACQRYYYRPSGTSTMHVRAFNSGNAISTILGFPVTMRKVPAINHWDLGGTWTKVSYSDNGGTMTNGIAPPNYIEATPSGWSFTAGGIGATSNGVIRCGFEAIAEL